LPRLNKRPPDFYEAAQAGGKRAQLQKAILAEHRAGRTMSNPESKRTSNWKGVHNVGINGTLQRTRSLSFPKV
jgi:hypothetical protein